MRDTDLIVTVDVLQALREENKALKEKVERLQAENHEYRILYYRYKNLLNECIKLSKLCFPKKHYSKESLFKIIDKIYMLVLAVDDAPDTKKGEKNNE